MPTKCQSDTHTQVGFPSSYLESQEKLSFLLDRGAGGKFTFSLIILWHKRVAGGYVRPGLLYALCLAVMQLGFAVSILVPKELIHKAGLHP